MYEADHDELPAGQALCVSEVEQELPDTEELLLNIDLVLPDEAEQASGWRISTWIFYLIAIIAALGTSVYAFLEPSESTVDEVSEEWWDAMPLQTKILSVATAVDTQIVYTVFFSFFVESAFWKLKDALTQCFHSCKAFTVSTSMMFLAASAALANAAIIYAGFLWLPLGQITAIFPSVFNYMVVFASRYVGLGNLTNRVFNLFDNDAHLQDQVVFCLEHIKPELVDQINTTLEDKECDEASLVEVFQDLSNRENPIVAIHNAWYFKKTAGILFDAGFAITIFVTSFILFAQKGFDGVELLSNDRLSKANPLVKITLGTIPGAVSAIFMALNAFDFRKVMLAFGNHLRHHPKDIPLAIIVLFMNILTAFSAWRNVAGSTITPDNIFSLTDKLSNLGQAYMYINSIGSCVATFKPMCLKMMEYRPPVTRLDGMRAWAQENRISPVAAAQLRRFSLFGGNVNRQSLPQLDVIDSPEHGSPVR